MYNNFPLYDDAERVYYALGVASVYITSGWKLLLNQESQIVQEYLWTARVILGLNDPSFNHKEDVPCLNPTKFKPENELGWFSGFSSNSLYNRVFLPVLGDRIHTLSCSKSSNYDEFGHLVPDEQTELKKRVKILLLTVFCNLSEPYNGTYHIGSPNAYNYYGAINLASKMSLIPTDIEKLSFDRRKSSNDGKGSTYFSAINFAETRSTYLANILKLLPQNIKQISFSYNKLGDVCSSGRIEILSAIPKHVTNLDLTGNNLGGLKEEELSLLLGSLNENIKQWKLRSNNLSKLGKDGLSALLEKTPKHVYLIDLSNNELSELGAEGLAQVLAAIPSHVTCLSLEFNNLGTINLNGLTKALQNLKPEIEYLNLNCNKISVIKGKDSASSEHYLAQVLKALPVRLGRLELGHLYFSDTFRERQLDIEHKTYKPLTEYKNYHEAQIFAEALKNLPKSLIKLYLSRHESEYEGLRKAIEVQPDFILAEMFKHLPERVTIPDCDFLERSKRGKEQYQKIYEGQRSQYGYFLLKEVQKFDAKTSAIDSLLKKYADINYQDTNGYTPLMTAIDAQNERIAEYLLNEGADIEIKNASGKRAIDLVSSNTALYELLKQRGKSTQILPNDTKGTPPLIGIADLSLQEEIEKDAPQTRRIAALLKDGASINYQEPKDGFTVLMLAVDKQNDRIAEYLLAHGADPLLQNKNKEKASDLSSRTSSLYPILKGYELYYAVLNKDIILTKVLIQSGADVNFQSIDGYTPLLLAVEQGFLPGIEFLLTSGADRDLTRNDGQGILDLVSDEDALALLTEENWYSDDSNIDGSDIDSVKNYGFFGGSSKP